MQVSALAKASWAAGASTQVVEYYHAALDRYFVTWGPAEITILDAGVAIKGWGRTGHAWRVYTATQGATSPVCRFYIPPELGDSHFYGRRATECEATGASNPSFVPEDAQFMHLFLPVDGVCPAGTTNVYRVCRTYRTGHCGVGAGDRRVDEHAVADDTVEVPVGITLGEAADLLLTS